MCKSYCRVRRIYALSAVSGSSVNIDTHIVRIEIDFHIVYFRQHCDRGSRCMDPAARLGLRHSLHSVRSALVLESGICALSLDEKDCLLDAAKSRIVELDQLCLPAITLRISRIHPQKIRTEQRRFLAACSCSDLKDNVLFIVRVFREKKHLELILLLPDQLFELGDLHLREFAHLLIALFKDLFGIGQISLRLFVFLVFLYDRLHLAHFLDVLLPHRLIVDHFRVRNLLSQFIVFFCYKI